MDNRPPKSKPKTKTKFSRHSRQSFRAVPGHHPTIYRSRTESNPTPAPIHNPNYTAVSETFGYTGDHTKFVLVMVGIPARGKSYIARKIRSYLSWIGYDVEWFNIGEYRRLCAKNTVGQTSSDFFSPSNSESGRQRELFALLAISDLEKYLFEGGQVGILDGTNSTKHRRKMIRNYFSRKNRLGGMNVKLVWIEPICNDERIIERNIANVKTKSKDYADVPMHEAVADFKTRIKHYERMYVPVSDDEGAYIKLIDAGKQVIGHQVSGYIPSRILYFLMHLNLTKVPLFFSRHGESMYNVQTRIGGDSSLSPQGEQYAKTMTDFISLQPEYKNLKIWCSTLHRCVQTASHFLKDGTKVLQWRALAEIECGICDGMTYEEVQRQKPKEFEARKADKLSYRYPQGESYKDVIKRLEPVIFEMERAERPVLVVAHRAIIRCLYAYFMDEPIKKIPYLPIDLHTVYKLSPTDYSTDLDRFVFGLVATKPTIGRSIHSSDFYRLRHSPEHPHTNTHQFTPGVNSKNDNGGGSSEDDETADANRNVLVTNTFSLSSANLAEMESAATVITKKYGRPQPLRNSKNTVITVLTKKKKKTIANN